MLLFESILIGIAIGLLAGALGIGGGILAIPVLVYLLGQDPHAATAESLVIILVTSAAALPSRFKNHQVRLSVGAIFGFCSAFGAVVGARLNAVVNGDLVMLLFAALLVGVAITMLNGGLRDRRAENAAIASGTSLAEFEAEAEPDDVRISWRKIPLMLLIGSGTGLLVGFFGIGGGFAMIPVLVFVMRYSIRVAAGTSFIVILVLSVTALLSRIGTGVQIDWLVAILFAIGSGVGSAIGSPLSNRARASTLTFIFVALLVVVAIYICITTVLGVAV